MQNRQTSSQSESARRAGPRETSEAYLYLAPAGLILFVFWFLPVLASFGISFTNWEGADTLDIVGWVGLRNYERSLGDDAFWRSLANTVNYTLYAVPLTLFVSLAVALLLHQNIGGRSFFRAAFFVPYVSAWVAVSVLLRYFFDPEFGPLNYLLSLVWETDQPLRWLREPRGVIKMFAMGPLGIESWPRYPIASPFIDGPSLAMLCVILASVWHDMGFFVVVFLVGLDNIDRTYYEAAMIDGAGPWKRLKTITLPLLTPTTFFCLVIAAIGAFRVFVPIMVMTPGGGPGKTTATLVYHMYEKGFMEWKLGQGAAIALLMFALIFVFTMVQNRLFGRRVQYEQ